MAKAPAKKKEDNAPAKSSGAVGIIGLVVATVLAGGAGAAFGLMVLAPGASVAGLGDAEVKAKPADMKMSPVGQLRVRPLAPIITNLAGESKAWVRLEAAVVLETEELKDLNLLIAKISEDVTVYMRTVSLDQLEGSNALQNIKEDLNDRVRIRSEGKIKELLVYGLVAE